MRRQKQTYANYYKDYFAGRGRAVRRRAENKYRNRLMEFYQTTERDALELNKNKV